MKSPYPKLLFLAMAITSGLCVSLNLAYSMVVKKLSAPTEYNLSSAEKEKPNTSAARKSYAS